jgi:hypothetical protein
MVSKSEDTDPLSLSQQSLDYSNASQTFPALNQSGGMVAEALFQVGGIFSLLPWGKKQIPDTHYFDYLVLDTH